MRLKLVVGVLMAVCLAGCASLDGQVGATKNILVLTGLGQTAIPVPKTQADGTAYLGTNVYVPLLGGVAIGKKQTGATPKSRRWFYWQDPSRYFLCAPSVERFDPSPGGYVSGEGASLSKSFSVDANVTGIKLSQGSIAVAASATATLTIAHTRMVEADLSSLDYLAQLADTKAANQSEQVYFVYGILVGDPTDATSFGGNVSFQPLQTSKYLSADLKADYESNYSGVALALGVEYARVDNAASLNSARKAITEPAVGPAMMALDAAKLAALRVKAIAFDDTFKKLNLTAPEPPFTSHKSGNNVTVNFVSPFTGGNGQVQVDGEPWQASTVASLGAGDHDVRYFTKSGNLLYTTRVRLTVDMSTNAGVTENEGVRQTRLIDWKVVAPDELAPPSSN